MRTIAPGRYYWIRWPPTYIKQGRLIARAVGPCLADSAFTVFVTACDKELRLLARPEEVIAEISALEVLSLLGGDDDGQDPKA